MDDISLSLKKFAKSIADSEQAESQVPAAQSTLSSLRMTQGSPLKFKIEEPSAEIVKFKKDDK